MAHDILAQGLDILTNPKHTRWIAPLLLAVDAVLCAVVVWKVPYTEIDWQTYNQQIALFVKGERDYKLISGSTGPLVYPGAHVWIYRVLYAVTDEGRNVVLAQVIFGAVYLLALAVVCACYRGAKVPPYVLPLLILSKRMHSIFLLRLFNDCFAVLGLFSAIYAYQRDWWHLGSFLYTTGLNVKMSLLLPLPAIGMCALQALGGREAITQGMIVFQVSVMYGYPFRKRAPSYFARAFELSRAFLYKWTVNWRFIPETTFLSKPFALSLLIVHASLLLLFATTRWNAPSRRPLKTLLKLIWAPEPRDQVQVSRRVNPKFIMTSMLTAMVVGLLCARSLHYQFYAYLAWATPFLLWRARFHPVLIYVLWGLQEWAWNVYPSTPLSSGVVVTMLAVQVAGVWWGTRDEVEESAADANGGPVGVNQHAHLE